MLAPKLRGAGIPAGGGVNNDFVFTVATTVADEVFTIPCQNVGTFNATIDWGDGSSDSTITTYNDADLAHTYATAGTHTITISGTFPNIHFNNAGDASKVRTVTNLGSVGWTRLDDAWWGCDGMTSFEAGDCDTSSVTNILNMVRDTTSLTVCDVTTMDVSSVITMQRAFQNTNATDVNLSGWDISGLNAPGSLNNILNSSSMTTANYDATLIAWSNLTVQSSMSPNFGTSTYTSGGAAETARTSLINDDSWTITDGGAA